MEQDYIVQDIQKYLIPKNHVKKSFIKKHVMKIQKMRNITEIIVYKIQMEFVY